MRMKAGLSAAVLVAVMFGASAVVAEQQDPIADSARAILDGHVVLSRRLVEEGHFPAIDIEASISRAMNQVTEPEHQEAARWLKRVYSTYEKNRDLINVGAYSRGTDARIDEAIAMHPHIVEFLQQDMNVSVSYGDSLHDLGTVIETTTNLPQKRQ